MRIYLVRHGIAVDHGTPGIAEDDRPLTPEGHRKMRRNARALDRLKPCLDEIWTSPLPRCRQSAEILAAGLKFQGPLRNLDELRPEADLPGLASALQEAGLEKNIALVGHEPSLSAFTTWLITGQLGSAVQLKKGAVACVEIDQLSPPSGGRLLWLLPPSHAARMVE